MGSSQRHRAQGIRRHLFINGSGTSLLLILLAACGGGGGNSRSTLFTVTSVSPVCTPSTIAANATSQCNATVKGTGNYSSTVIWSASGGTVSTSGVFTAPASAGAVTVTATSTQDPTKSGTASVTVQPPASSITSVQVDCTPSTVLANATSQCSATVKGMGSYNSAVNWSASDGTINASGLFTAPASAGTVTVTATSMQDSTKSGTASVAVQSSGSTITSVQVACTPSTVDTNATSQCSATVKGTDLYNPDVTWSASDGAINASGVFTAPATAGAATITATSVQDRAKSGKANITVQSPQPHSQHVVMVMEENQSYATVDRDSNWPNLNVLIANGSLPTNYYANTHPSIGNYFMLTTGQVLTNDDRSVTVWNVDNIARRMLSSNTSFRIYAEGISRGYIGGNTGPYLVRHNPFARLSDIANDPQIANQTIWPFTQFATDLASGTLPEFSFIVPNVNNDAHDGTPQQADSWLQTNVVIPLSNDPAFAPGGDGLLIVNFDEAAESDITHGGGLISPVLWGPIAKVGYTQTSSTLYQHQSMLRTVMDLLGLPNPPGAAATAPSMWEFFVQK